MQDLSSFTLTTLDEVRLAQGALVRALRQREKWTQAMLAKKAGVPASTLSLFERDGSGSLDTFLRALNALGELDAFSEAIKTLAKKTAAPRTMQDLLAKSKNKNQLQQRVRVPKKTVKKGKP